MMPWGRSGIAGGVVVMSLLPSPGCFDSDERFSRESLTSSETLGPTMSGSMGADSTTVGASTSSSTTAATLEDPNDGSGGNPDLTCEDGIRCVQQCISILISEGVPPDPDLTCVVQCMEMLTVRQAYNLLLLSNCVADVCEAEGLCGNATSEDEGEEELPIGTCLNCMRIRIADSDRPECQTEHAICD